MRIYYDILLDNSSLCCIHGVLLVNFLLRRSRTEITAHILPLTDFISVRFRVYRGKFGFQPFKLTDWCLPLCFRGFQQHGLFCSCKASCNIRPNFFCKCALCLTAISQSTKPLSRHSRERFGQQVDDRFVLHVLVPT